jgi:hypothetical protein
VLKKKDDLKNYIIYESNVDDEAMQELINEIGVARAAPFELAKLFKESMKESWWQILGGTDEELLQKLLLTINNKDDYFEVNEYYQGNLIEDINDEYYTFFGLREIPALEDLNKILGHPSTVNAAKSGLNNNLVELLDDLAEDPKIADLKRLDKALNSNQNNYFTTVNNNKPTNLIDTQKLVAIYAGLQTIVAARTFTDEEQELFFSMLEGIDAEIERLYSEDDGFDNTINYRSWKQNKEAAEENWFKGS